MSWLCFAVLFFLLTITLIPSFAQRVNTLAGDVNIHGKPATSVGIARPLSMAADPVGNIYLTDGGLLRKVEAATGLLKDITGNYPAWWQRPQNFIQNVYQPNLFVTADKHGIIFLADGHRIWKYDAAQNRIFQIAGNTGAPVGGDNGPALQAGFSFIFYIATDTSGNLFVGDNAAVRKIDGATGIITTIAGASTVRGNSGDGGPAIAARFGAIRAIAPDQAGNVFILDDNNVIRRVDRSTQIVTRFAGNGSTTNSGDGGPALNAGFARATSIVFDANDNLYVSDLTRIRKIDPTGTITAFAGDLSKGYSGDGGTALAARFRNVVQLSVTPDQQLLVCDYAGASIRKINLGSGIISTVAGNGLNGNSGFGQPLSGLQLTGPNSVAIDSNSNVYIGSIGSTRIIKIDTKAGVASLFAGSGNDTANIGNEGPAIDAGFAIPAPQAVDSKNNLYVLDAGRFIRKINLSTGVISLVAGTGLQGSTGDGGPALQASFNSLSALTIDKNDNIYITEGPSHRIRKISAATGMINTIAGTGTQGYSGDGGPATAAQLMLPAQLAVDSKGNLFFFDFMLHLRRIDAQTGIITTIANRNGTRGNWGDGGLAINAPFSTGKGLTVDSNDDLFIADYEKVRKIDMITGIITAAVGTDTAGYNGENISADSARLLGNSGIVFDAAGNMFIVETERNAIRKVSAFPPSEKKILNGKIYFDFNKNNSFETSDSLANNLEISITKPNFHQVVISDRGMFKAALDTGHYVLHARHRYYKSSPDSIQVHVTAAGVDSISIALQSIGSVVDLKTEILALSPARPGFDVSYRINYMNDGTVDANNVNLFFLKSTRLNITKTVPAYTSIEGDTLRWNFSSVNVSDKPFITIYGKLMTPPVVNVNDTIFQSAFISHGGTDSNKINDTTKLKQRVTGSYDPNDKTEIHGGSISPQQIAQGNALQYLMRFQNTGTDTAFKVVIRDTLSSLLDVSSLEMVSASHNYYLNIEDGNKLVWTFENILLPDSNRNEIASHGFVAFRIKPLSSVVEGDVINNKSAIYFDYNLPIITNTVSTKVKQLPPIPPKPTVDPTPVPYCVTTGGAVKLGNKRPDIAATLIIGNNSFAAQADSTFQLRNLNLSPGQYEARIEYVNESGASNLRVPVIVSNPVTPSVKLSASKNTLTSEQDVIFVTMASSEGGGTKPTFIFARDRNFTQILQGEGHSFTVAITASNTNNGDNWIFVRMRTNFTCYTTETAIDSFRVIKNLTTTGIVDIDNPAITITAYPNPFSNQLTLSGLLPFKKYVFQLYDVNGRVLSQSTINSKSTHTIQLASLPNGVYWIKLFDVVKSRNIGVMSVLKK